MPSPHRLQKGSPPLPDGTVVAVFKGGDSLVGAWGHPQIAISRDGGQSVDAAAVHRAERPRRRLHGPWPDPRRPPLVLCFVQPHAYQDGLWDTSQVGYGPVWEVRSTDGGRTWSEPVAVDTRSTPVPDGCSRHGRMAQLADGTVLMSLYLSAPEDGSSCRGATSG